MTTTVIDTGIVATTAAVIAGFGTTAFVFRLQRELELRKSRIRSWVPWADRLLIGATMCALLLVLLPLIVAYRWTFLGQRLPAAGCAASIIAVA